MKFKKLQEIFSPKNDPVQTELKAMELETTLMHVGILTSDMRVALDELEKYLKQKGVKVERPKRSA